MSEQAKHTPGTLEATAPDGEYHDVIRIYSAERPDIPVAVCPQLHSAGISVLMGQKNDITEAAANARRFVLTWNSHNDLLEALKKAHDRLYDIPDWPGLECDHELDYEIAAAIANTEKETVKGSDTEGEAAR